MLARLKVRAGHEFHQVPTTENRRLELRMAELPNEQGLHGMDRQEFHQLAEPPELSSPPRRDSVNFALPADHDEVSMLGGGRRRRKGEGRIQAACVGAAEGVERILKGQVTYMAKQPIIWLRLGDEGKAGVEEF